jgi:hypothetical protein
VPIGNAANRLSERTANLTGKFFPRLGTISFSPEIEKLQAAAHKQNFYRSIWTLGSNGFIPMATL